MHARSIAQQIGNSSAVGAIAGLLERALPVRANSLHVLMYHRVASPGERPDLHPGLLSATPEGFEEQVAFLASSGRVVSLETVLAAQRGEARLPQGAILITFDDAYLDFGEHAWPLLATRELPVVLFVATAYPDAAERHFWWDRLHVAVDRAASRDAIETPAGTLPLRNREERVAARRAIGGALEALEHAAALQALDELCVALDAEDPAPAVLSWSELDRFSREGVTLAPHTRTHPLLGRIALEAAIEEIVGSRDDLAARFGTIPPAIAYPGGSYTDELVAALPTRGFELGLTTQRGRNTIGATDPLRFNRVNVGISSTLPLIRTQLLLLRR
jgi:peptidoglycan/xylan/chitin deacetylase (PgdA/CDA1 family)